MMRPDARTYAIVVLSVAVLLMGIFSSGGGGVELKKLLNERDQQNKELQRRIDQRNEDIKILRDSARYYMEQDRIKAEAIIELERIKKEQEKSIIALKSRMNGSIKPIEDATDERRVELWRDYFEQMNIKQ